MLGCAEFDLAVAGGLQDGIAWFGRSKIELDAASGAFTLRHALIILLTLRAR